MIRVAGTDPGTTGLDILILEGGLVKDQVRFSTAEIQANHGLPVSWLEQRGPFDLIAGPSGYGLPLIRAPDCTDRQLALMTLVRPDNHGLDKQGVLGFSGMVRALRACALPVVFIPGVIHLPTVPSYRKINRIDLGTADKLCVAVLALDRYAARLGVEFGECDFCVVELGSAFTACVVVQGGKIVDGVGGTCGPLGWRSGGAWDGEVAYLLSPLAKRDLFAGGVQSQPDAAEARRLFRESLFKAVAGLQAVTPFNQLLLSGRLLERESALAECLTSDLTRLGDVTRLESLPGAWVKEAAQGAALVADGLAGGHAAALVNHVALQKAAGTVLDWLSPPRDQTVRAALGVG